MRRALALVILTVAPLSAQSGQAGSQIPGLTLNTSFLLPMPTGATQFPSGRFTVAKALGSFSVHGGALHLTPQRSGMWAGVAGAQFDLLEGPFRAAPFLDVGFGRVVQAVQTGTVPTSDGEMPAFVEQAAGALGGGAGMLGEWRIRPHIGLTATAGYWYFAAGSELNPVSGFFFGGGLRVGLPFGGITATQPPVPAGPLFIQIEEPAAWTGGQTRGLRAVARNSIRVVGTVRDPSGVGVTQVRLNGELAALRPMDGGGSLARFVGFVPVDEQTNAVEVTALAADGRRANNVYEVTPTIPRASEGDARAAMERATGNVDVRRFAVVIGVSDYVDDAIPDLEYADDDAQAFYDFLRSERAGMGGIPEENIQLLINEDATYRNMRSALYTFLEQATDDDLVYIYIAAHGAPNPNRPDDLYILPFDAESEDIGGTGLPMQHVNEAIQKLYARHTVLFTDACHSGGIGMSGFATRAAPGDETLNAINRAFLQDLQATQSGLAILTASEARQLSREGEQWGGGHGVFTWYLLQGLEGRADADGDQIVALGELLEYVRDGVRRETSNGQIPSVGGNAFDRYMPMAVVPPDDDN